LTTLQTKDKRLAEEISQAAIAAQGNRAMPRVMYPISIPPGISAWCHWSRPVLLYHLVVKILGKFSC